MKERKEENEEREKKREIGEACVVVAGSLEV